MAPSAQEAAAQAGRGDSVTGWKLDRDQRRELLQQFPPRYRNVVADHVTLQAKASGNSPLPQENEGEILGRVDDGQGVEAMVVSIGGTTDRPDGSTYHITWSLEDGRKATREQRRARPRELDDVRRCRCRSGSTRRDFADGPAALSRLRRRARRFRQGRDRRARPAIRAPSRSATASAASGRSSPRRPISISACR